MSIVTDNNTCLLGGVHRTTQTVAVGDSSVASSAIAKGAVLRIVSTTNCHINLGATAASNSAYLPANVVEFIGIGGSTTVNVIRNSADGTLFVTVIEPLPGFNISTAGSYGG